MGHARLMVLCTTVFLCTAVTLFQSLHWVDMRSLITIALSSGVVALNTTVDLRWHAPKKSWINDLKRVLNGTGTNGFVFNSSQLPQGVQYGTYNWCNMPHVRAQEYPKASEEYQLVYVEV
jgi:hypothetical protein